MLLLAAGANASELVYTPINPSFGGNPLNGTHLMSTAQAVNHYQDPTPSFKQSSLEQFSSSLQSSILSRVSSAVSSNIVSSTGQLIPGSLETNDFRITVTSLGTGVLRITTTDKTTGQTTQFEVNQP